MRLPVLAFAALGLIACAGRPATAPRTAQEGDVVEHEAAERAPAAADGKEPATVAAAAPTDTDTESGRGTDEDRPPGDLVCRAVDDGGGATELFLQWNGSEASGVLREVAPSGMVHEKKVRAERLKDLVIADDIYEKDLVNHAAIVAQRAGKKAMKVDDAWSNCQ